AASSGMLGLNLRWDVINSAQLYAQLALATDKKEELSYQIGAKFYPFKNFFFQAEYNVNTSDFNLLERPAFQHYGESLNYGSRFVRSEVVLRTSYIHKRIVGDFKFNIMDNSKMKAFFMDICGGYVLNPSTNLSVNVGLQSRNAYENTEESRFFYLAIRTNLQNVYYDF